MCELCDSILYKDNKGRLTVKKCFVLHEEFINVFHEEYFIPTIEKLSFHLAHIRSIGAMECRKTRNKFFYVNALKIYIMQKNSSK